MHGNVLEWCLDWQGTYPGTVTDPAGAASGSYRVLRGGSWGCDARYCRSALRGGNWPDYRFYGLGFRAARTLPTGLVQYTLTVVSGAGSSAHAAGTVVAVTAGAAPAGQGFSSWTVTPQGTDLGASFNARNPSTTVIMPPHDVTLTANFSANQHTATFDAQGGSAPAPASKTVTRGSAYGALPAVSRSGYTFGGWWTGPGGTGTRVLTTTVVTVSANHTLYAKWVAGGGGGDDDDDDDDDPDDGRLCPPVGNAAEAAPGSYDGFFHAAEDFDGTRATAVRGTLTLKVTSAAGKLSAKVTLLGGNVSFSAKVWSEVAADGTCRATLAARGGETLDLFVRGTRIWGTLQGGKAGATPLALDGGRNRFADRGDASAAAELERFRGYCTVALPTHDREFLGDAEAAPAGVGYLAVTVGTKGSAKIAGVLADGTKVSRAGRLILFTDCGDAACVPLFAPLYIRMGWAGGLLWLDPAARTVTTDRDAGWFIRWEKPGKGPDGFRMLLDACGGFYSSAAALAAGYLFSAEADAPYWHAEGMETPVELPDSVPVAVAGMRLAMAQGAKPLKVVEEGGVWYEYDEVNPTQAKLMFTARTGIFKGSFILYYDYDIDGRLQHKAVKAPYSGILTPLRDAAFDDLPAGMGHCLVPESAPAFKALSLKRSYPVRLEAGE